MTTDELEALFGDLARDGFGDWLAGFIDGEGCFRIKAMTGGRGRSTYSHLPALHVALRDDDRSILETIVTRTGIGKIKEKKRNGPSQSQVTWTVQKKSDIRKLVHVLDRFPLRAKKARDYAIWREAVLFWMTFKVGYYPGQINGIHQVLPRQTKLADLKAKLENVRKYRPTQPTDEPIEEKAGSCNQGMLFS